MLPKSLLCHMFDCLRAQLLALATAVLSESQLISCSATSQRPIRFNFLLLLCCRGASVEAVTPLVCLTLDRATFTAVLGPLQQLMSREKSAAVVTQRLMKLQSRGGPSRVPAEVLVRRRRRSKSKGTDVWEVVRSRGHLDEVLELRGGQASSAGAAVTADAAGNGSSSARGEAAADGNAAGTAMAQLVLTEGTVLGGGAFSRVSVVQEQTTGRSYALKRMRKSAVVQCPEHVFCEQTITRNLTHPFCIRQYASFQVGLQQWGSESCLVSAQQACSGFGEAGRWHPGQPNTQGCPTSAPPSAHALYATTGVQMWLSDHSRTSTTCTSCLTS